MLNVTVVSWSLGFFIASTFVLCLLYGLVVPPSMPMTSALEMVLPAFKWLTLWGFLLGLLERFLYGVYAGLVFVPISTVSPAGGASQPCITSSERRTRDHGTP